MRLESRGWAKTSACRLQVSLSCVLSSGAPYPLPDRVAPVFVQVFSPPLGWSPLSSFLVIWSPSGDRRGPLVIFEAVDVPCSGPFHFSHIADYIYDFCPLPDPDVGLLSVYVMLSILLSILVCTAASSVLVWSVSMSLCTICHS